MDATIDLDQRLVRIEAALDELLAQKRAQSELIDEATPILRLAGAAAIDELDRWEKAGRFRVLRAAARVATRVADAYTEEDLHQLGDAVVGILDTVRTLTQPEVLAVLNEAGRGVGEGAEPVGVMGLASATRDADVQRGLGVLLELVRHVGQASARRQGEPRGTAPRREIPVRREQSLPAGRPPSRLELLRARKAAAGEPPAPHCATPAPAVVPAGEWTPALATALAAEAGIPTLTEAHWTVLNAARADHAKTGSSPNIRRLTQVAGLSTRELYALFPKAPGKTVAQIAGLPKPAGCI